jgi:hypothetical protein
MASLVEKELGKPINVVNRTGGSAVILFEERHHEAS